MNNAVKELEKFLDKETPTYGGCMVCLVVDGRNRSWKLLIERHKAADCDIFTINSRLFYEYDFLWEDTAGDWKILWKYDGGE